MPKVFWTGECVLGLSFQLSPRGIILTWSMHRFLDDIIREYVLAPTLLPNILLAARTALLPDKGSVVPKALLEDTNNVDSVPNNERAITTTTTTTTTKAVSTSSTMSEPTASTPTRYRPAPAEIAAIRRRCASKLLSLVPPKVARTLLKTSEDHDAITVNLLYGQQESLLRTIETDLLDLLSDEYCNRHLIYSLLETVLARIMPELSERSVSGLMRVRGINGHEE